MSEEAFKKILQDSYEPTTHEEFLILMYRRVFEHERDLLKRESELKRKQSFLKKNVQPNELQMFASKNRPNS